MTPVGRNGPARLTALPKTPVPPDPYRLFGEGLPEVPEHVSLTVADDDQQHGDVLSTARVSGVPQPIRRMSCGSASYNRAVVTSSHRSKYTGSSCKGISRPSGSRMRWTRSHSPGPASPTTCPATTQVDPFVTEADRAR